MLFVFVGDVSFFGFNVPLFIVSFFYRVGFVWWGCAFYVSWWFLQR